MIRKLGHCLGIDHVTGRKSVMNQTASMTTKMTKRDVAMFVERREAIGNAVRNAP